MKRANVCSLFNLAICSLITRIKTQLMLTITTNMLLEKKELDRKNRHALALSTLCFNICTKKIVDMEDIIFEFCKITYYYKFFNPPCKMQESFNNLWVYAHFPISELKRIWDNNESTF